MFKKVILNKTAMRILNHLSQRPLTALYEWEIAHQCKISTGAVNKAMRELNKVQLVTTQKKGRISFHRFNLDHPVARELKAFFNVLRLYSLIEELRPVSKRIIVFGSYASGTDTEKSDIDIFILTTEDPKRFLLPIRKAGNAIGKHINPIIADAQKAAAMKDTAFYQNIMKGKVLWDRHEP